MANSGPATDTARDDVGSAASDNSAAAAAVG